MSIEGKKKIFLEQKKIINNCFEYLDDIKKYGIKINLSPFCFFTTWTKSFGYFKIQQFNKQYINFDFLIFFFKNILSVLKYGNFELICNKKIFENKSYRSIILSYCDKLSFNNKNIFFDKYFGISSNETDQCIFILISLDNFIPNEIHKNILIIKRKISLLNILFFVYFFFLVLFKNKFNLKKFFHYFNYEHFFITKINIIFEKIFSKIEFKNFLINYEGINFQNFSLEKVKKMNGNIQTIGYLHCAPWPLQTDLICKTRYLDKLFVSSFDQKDVLNKYFKWPEKKIFTIPSLRFNKSSNTEFSNFIFLPYYILNKKKYLEHFQDLLVFLANSKLGRLNTRIHPLNKNSKQHKIFAQELKIILKKYQHKIDNRVKNVSIFIGSATGVCCQALEENNIIYHIPGDHILDVFSPYIWKSIDVLSISSGIFKYSIKKKNKIFYVNSEKKKFIKYINPHLK